MRKITFIFLSCVALYLIEFLIFNHVHRLLVPNLLLILIIFVNLIWGIRFSIITALFAGLLMDSFASYVFGVNIFTFVLCAYITTYLNKNIYESGSESSKLTIVFFLLCINIVIQYVLSFVIGNLSFVNTFQYIFLPEIICTLLVTSISFKILRRCVLRYFV